MEFNTRQFLYDYNIQTVENSSTTTSKYIGLQQCVFCGATATGNKAYGAVMDGYTVHACWVCHNTSFYEFVKRATGITDYTALKEIFKKYGNSTSTTPFKKSSDVPRPTTIKIPGNTIMSGSAKEYIEGRGFNPEYLWEKYALRSTMYENPSYRIIIPITYNNRIVSYTSRDYTNEQELRVVSCKSDLEIINHKDIFLGIDQIRSRNALIVEGPWDQFRTGNGSLCSFGAEITMAQIMLLAQRFDNVFIMPDGGEAEPLRIAEETAIVLNSVGTNCEVIELHETGDPDELFRDDPDELAYLKNDLQIY